MEIPISCARTNHTHIDTRVVTEVQQTIKSLKDKGIKIEINWTPGHAEIDGNEIADRLAKQGADEAEEMPEPSQPTEAVCLFLLLYVPCQHLWSLWDGQFT